MMHIRRSIQLCLLLLTLVTSAAWTQPIKPIPDRLDAIVAHPLVLAIQVEDERDLRSGVTTRLDDGRSIVSTPFWVGLVPYTSLPAWTASFGQWDAIDFERARATPKNQRPAGSWFISVPLPIDAVGQGLWFGQTRYELNWLPDPERSLLEADSAQRTRDFARFWAQRLDDDALQDPAVREAIAQFHRDPFNNWRARLLVDGLDPDRTRARETLAAEPDTLDALELQLQQTPANALLSAVARQQEARWQIILGRIWLIDPQTAQRLKQALTRTARFDTRTLPLWNADSSGLARLAHDLLSPFVDDQTRVLRANAWLEAQPRAISWIIDDQGQLEAGTDRFLPTLGVVSLPSTPGDSLLRIDNGFASPLLRTVPPATLVREQFPIEPIEIDPASPVIETTPVTLQLARKSMRHELIASRVPAKAPFVRIGPLLSDWTMTSLTMDRPLEGASPIAQRATLGILRRTTAPSRTNPRGGWQLYIECASAQPGRPGDSLSVWVGPRSNPLGAWRITADARVEPMPGVNASRLPLPSVQTRLLQDRWVAQITFPQDAFDEQGQLILGIERSDSDGVHSAWPRRMFPGQTQPGRLIITPDRYDQLRLRDP